MKTHLARIRAYKQLELKAEQMVRFEIFADWVVANSHLWDNIGTNTKERS